MKLSPNSAPVEPDDLLIRLHNMVAAAIDITGKTYGSNTRWDCHGCGAHSEYPELDILAFTRDTANAHAASCRAAYHRLT
ncbi:hypothetical protein AR457_16455 [Streptomyces agglomeratus]|uniref:hypothetical protein n=1 Tax=Streptomyces agglomeratus TaxID=285458 RepID=UPI00085480DB|nr:hypothetical protein [Streptomyces agglomeratus]OEJ40135.1 hypothetical protein BGK70_20195 [Streptomyces agglomeratus]OEJ45485.1 hypothetical protein AR457_16455 [Streptomyces agglomeratus]